jgi:hypothetical protein
LYFAYRDRKLSVSLCVFVRRYDESISWRPSSRRTSRTAESPCRRASYSPTCGATMHASAANVRWRTGTTCAKVAEHGARNSLLLMPTATTSTSWGPRARRWSYTSFVAEPGGREFIVVNRALVRMLDERGLWNEQKEAIIMAEGPSRASTTWCRPTSRCFQDVVGPQAEGAARARNRPFRTVPVQSTNLFMER